MSKTLKNKDFSLEDLAILQHETPYFLFSKKKILKNFEAFQRCFPGATINYAMKANSEPEILKDLYDAGSGFEVASKYELDILKGLHVSPERIIYGTAVKPADHIKVFYDYGVRTFAFDSLPELEKLAAIAPGSNVYVRMVVNDAGSVFKFSEKFGTDKTNLAQLLLRARDLGLKPYGISFHVGSQASNKDAWAIALENIMPSLVELKKEGIEIEVINIGGGFPCNTYASSDEDFTLEDIAESMFAQYKLLPYQPKLILEPGRGIIADTGIVIGTVIARIERREHTWLFLDTGVYNALFESMAYQGSTRYRVTCMRHSFEAGESLFALAGPTGDSEDVITREALLPSDIGVGDKIIFHDTGAYGITTASTFNGFPKLPVHFV